MDVLYCIPHLSGSGSAYTRLPAVTHGVFVPGPIGGTYAIPPNMSDALIAQLRGQHLAQSRFYGGATRAVAFTPPPPTRGRSTVREPSAVRAKAQPPPAPRPDQRIGVSICSALFSSCLSVSPLIFWTHFRSPGRPSCFPTPGWKSRAAYQGISRSGSQACSYVVGTTSCSYRKTTTKGAG